MTWNFIPKITVVAEKKTNNKSSTRCQDERWEIGNHNEDDTHTHTIFLTLAHLQFFALLSFLNFIFNFSRVQVIFYSETNMIGHIFNISLFDDSMYSTMIHWQHTKTHLLNGRTRRVKKKVDDHHHYQLLDVNIFLVFVYALKIEICQHFLFCCAAKAVWPLTSPHRHVLCVKLHSCRLNSSWRSMNLALCELRAASFFEVLLIDVWYGIEFICQLFWR